MPGPARRRIESLRGDAGRARHALRERLHIYTGFEYDLLVHVTTADGSLYDQSDDYSYNGDAVGAPTTKVTAYVNRALIHGTEP